MSEMSRPKGYEWKIVLVLALVWGAVCLDRLAVPFLFPVIVPEFHLNNAQAGAVTAILAVTWGVASWLMGNLSDRIGRKKVLLPSIIFFSVMSWFTGLTRSFAGMMAVRGLLGFGEGAVFSVSVATLSEESTPARRGLNIGTFQCGYPLIGVGVGAMICTQLAHYFGWRPVMFIVGIPGLVLAAILGRLMMEPRSTFLKAENLSGETAGGAGEGRPGFFAALKYRNVWVSTLVSCLFMNWLYNLTTFVALFLTQLRGIPLTTAGTIISVMGFGGFAGMILLSGLSDQFGRKPLILISTFCAGIFTLLFIVAGSNPFVLVCISFLIGIFAMGSYPIWLSVITSESVPVYLAGSAVGIPVAIGELFGAVLMPVIGGSLADIYGLQTPMYLAGVAPLIATVISLLYRETAPKVLARRASGAAAGS